MVNSLLSLYQSQAPIEELIEDGSFWCVPISEENIYRNWQTLLIFALMGSPKVLLAKKLHGLLNQPWNNHSSLMRTLVALNQVLADMPVHQINLKQLENGAIPIELHEYRPWIAIPFSPLHAQLGTYLSLIATLSKNEELKTQAIQAAKWQLNTLDYEFFPYTGLFTQEKNSTLTETLLWNYLFFRSVGFEEVAQAQLKHLNNGSIPPFFLLLKKIINETCKDFQKDLALSNEIYDSSMSLVGMRFPNHHVICTTHGAHTGLGAYRFHDVQILNYGPQFFPLEECQGFGIEGNFLSDHDMRKSEIELSQNSFALKGCVRFVDSGQFNGIWMETEQSYKDQFLDIKGHLLSMQGWENVAFSFFVKAKKCHVGTVACLSPSTFQRYEGKYQTVIFEGKKESIQLMLNDVTKGEMKIIPLGSGENFWGADFLVAYLLHPEESKYHWNVGPI